MVAAMSPVQSAANAGAAVTALRAVPVLHSSDNTY